MGAPRLGPRVLVLGGPTASGKSALAAQLARAVGGGVVSADSRQVYRGLEIGTAQPGRELRALAPHFLVGFVPPAATYSAGAYGLDARRVIAALERRGAPAVLCGGTGLYLRAALEGVPGPDLERAPRAAAPAAVGAGGPPDPASVGARRVRRAALAGRWRAEGGPALHAELARVDPVLAERVHPRDRQRVLRGLEFHAEHGVPLTSRWAVATGAGGARESADRRESPDPRPGAAEDGKRGASAPAVSETGPPGPLRFRLEVEPRELERRIHRRLEAMLGQGLVEEARALFERYADDPPASLDAVGYPELFAHFRGETDLQGALERIRRRTGRYAKRQRTWFRHQDAYAPVSGGSEAFSLLLEAWQERLR